jgi:hypothetical protein
MVFRAFSFQANAIRHRGIEGAKGTMNRHAINETAARRLTPEDDAILDLLQRSAAPARGLTPGEALTLEQTVEVLQRLRSRQRPGSPVSLYLDARRGA